MFRNNLKGVNLAIYPIFFNQEKLILETEYPVILVIYNLDLDLVLDSRNQRQSMIESILILINVKSLFRLHVESIVSALQSVSLSPRVFT